MNIFDELKKDIESINNIIEGYQEIEPSSQPLGNDNVVNQKENGVDILKHTNNILPFSKFVLDENVKMPEPTEEPIQEQEVTNEPQNEDEDKKIKEQELRELYESYSNYDLNDNSLYSNNFLMENFISKFYFTSLSVIGLYIVYKMINRSK